MKAHVTVCAIYYDEAPVPGASGSSFTASVGVERFFLYDNVSDDEHRRCSDPYVDEGLVVVHDWPTELGQTPPTTTGSSGIAIGAAGSPSSTSTSSCSRPDIPSLPEALRAFENHPGVCVGRREFTFSGHLKRPSGLVIESYTRVLPPRPGTANSFKCIVDAAGTFTCMSPHAFAYENGASPVDEQMQAVDPLFGDRMFPTERFCINHYFTKSAEEAYAKHTRVNAIGQQRRPPTPGFERRWAERDRVATYEDERILRFVPAVREALERRANGLPPQRLEAAVEQLARLRRPGRTSAAARRRARRRPRRAVATIERPARSV